MYSNTSVSISSTNNAVLAASQLQIRSDQHALPPEQMIVCSALHREAATRHANSIVETDSAAASHQSHNMAHDLNLGGGAGAIDLTNIFVDGSGGDPFSDSGEVIANDACGSTEASLDADEQFSDPVGNAIANKLWQYYGTDFRVSDQGVFMRQVDKEGDFTWMRLTTTPIHLKALTRDQKSENWGVHIEVTNRDGGQRELAIPFTLIAADKANEIASELASIGVGILPGKVARQGLTQLLHVQVPGRITAVAQIGWHEGDGRWVFVTPSETLVPSGFTGARPVLQTGSLRNKNGLTVSGTVTEWMEQVARPLARNSNVQLCVGTAFAGPLLKWAGEPPGFFHIHGASKTGKSLAAAIGQSVWGCPKLPGEADAFGAPWTGTAVGLERYAVLRSDIGASFDEIGEGSPKVIKPAIYTLANGTTKLRGTADIGLRPQESFRILGISTGEPTMQAFLSADGENVPAGLSVRLVDVPAEVQPGSVFESHVVDQIEEIGRTFYELTKKLHGAVGRAWLEHLVELGPDEVQRQLGEHRNTWLSLPAVAAVRAKATGQVRSVLNRFALVAAALRMAIEAGLLPWSVEDTDLGIAACMTRWATSRKGRLDLAGEIVSAVEQVREILTANLHGRFIHLRVDEHDHRLEYASPADENKRDTLGYVKDNRILVEASAWRNELCSDFDPKRTARHLRDEGLLIADDGKLQHQEKVLRGGSTEKARFYVLDMKVLEEGAGTGPAGAE